MAYRVLFLRSVLRFWLTCALLTVSAVAGAQPAPTVDQAIRGATTADGKLAGLLRQRAQLGERYQAELTAIDRLKKEKSSWRRERELSQNMADSNDTANQ